MGNVETAYKAVDVASMLNVCLEVTTSGKKDLQLPSDSSTRRWKIYIEANMDR